MFCVGSVGEKDEPREDDEEDRPRLLVVLVEGMKRAKGGKELCLCVHDGLPYISRNLQ